MEGERRHNNNEEYKSHNDDAIVLIIDGRAYDVSGFIDNHPGGRSLLLDVAGYEKDATAAFYSVHGGLNSDSILKLVVDLGPVSSPKKDVPVVSISMQEKLKGSGKGSFVTKHADRFQLVKVLSVFDMQKLAQKILAPAFVTYIEYGSEDEESRKSNHQAWKWFGLVPSVLRDVSKPNLSISLPSLGLTLKTPILIAPFAGSMLAHPDGELAVVRAAKVHDCGYVAPHYSGQPIYQLTQSGGRILFQLYAPAKRNGSLNREYVYQVITYLKSLERIAGIVLTVDSPTFGNRERTYRSQTWLDAINRECGGMPVPRALEAIHDKIGPHPGNAKSLDWEGLTYLTRLCNENGMGLLVKGVMSPQDALKAAQCGVQGVIVSNHGGRQLDGTTGTALVLSDCVRAIRSYSKECLVLIDGGIRRGKDVFRALSLGANAVLIGRPILYGLAGGQQGVEHVLGILHQELETVMQLSGCATVSNISSHHVRLRPSVAHL